MEKQSVFERLANRFSDCQVEIKRGKTLSDWDISDVMLTAGQVLFDAISSKTIDLRDTPSWFVSKPDGKREDLDGNERVYCSWDFYWLFTIKWLAKNKSDSGITFPGVVHCVNPEGYLHSGEDVTSFLLTLLHLRNENLKRAWLELAKASEDACLYLAQISKEPAEKEQKKKGIIGKLLKIIVAFIAFLATLLTSLYLLGWLEPIKVFFAKILWPK